jgi:hypothetical protein
MAFYLFKEDNVSLLSALQLLKKLSYFYLNLENTLELPGKTSNILPYLQVISQ